jgi:hypothetical protein
MIHASNKKASHRLLETPPRPPRRPPASPPTLRQALELCHFDQSRHVYIEGSETQLSFGESSSFATEIHFYCEPVSEPIQPPGHQQGPAQWHGHQVLLSKFNGCVSGEYRIGLDAQRHVIFQREVSPWIVTTTDVIPLHEWHSIVCTYDGHFMRIYIDCRHAAHVACGPQKTDQTSPTLLGADLCGYASAHHFEGYISEVSLWQVCFRRSPRSPPVQLSDGRAQVSDAPPARPPPSAALARRQRGEAARDVEPVGVEDAVQGPDRVLVRLPAGRGVAPRAQRRPPRGRRAV